MNITKRVPRMVGTLIYSSFNSALCCFVVVVVVVVGQLLAGGTCIPLFSKQATMQCL